MLLQRQPAKKKQPSSGVHRNSRMRLCLPAHSMVICNATLSLKMVGGIFSIDSIFRPCRAATVCYAFAKKDLGQGNLP
jgi:hypothetical protein